MNRYLRHAVAVTISSAAAAACLTTGLIIGQLAVRHGIANNFVVAVTISMIGVVAIPAYVVKKLLVDYW